MNPLSVISLLFLLQLKPRVASLPLDGQALSVINNDLGLRLPITANTSTLSSSTPALNDWENFAYPIPGSKQILKGRILTSKRLRPSALHYVLDGGMAQARQQIQNYGNVKLRNQDNPYTYVVPGSFFTIRSKISTDGRPVMTYGMTRDVFRALESVLEKPQRNFETSFVLTDEYRNSWGHGEIAAKPPSSAVSR